MRKFVISAVFVLLMCNMCWGAASEDMSVYLRKDVFDAKMESFMKEMRGEFQVMNAKLEALSRRVDDNYHNLEQMIDNNYHSLDTRISDVRNDVYLGLVILGIIVSLPVAQKMLSSREVKRQMITLEDVKRLIEENNAELRKSLQV